MTVKGQCHIITDKVTLSQTRSHYNRQGHIITDKVTRSHYHRHGHNVTLSQTRSQGHAGPKMGDRFLIARDKFFTKSAQVKGQHHRQVKVKVGGDIITKSGR